MRYQFVAGKRRDERQITGIKTGTRCLHLEIELMVALAKCKTVSEQN